MPCAADGKSDTSASALHGHDRVRIGGISVTRISLTVLMACAVEVWSLLFCGRAAAQPASDAREQAANGQHRQHGANGREPAHGHGGNGPTDMWLPATSPSVGPRLTAGSWTLATHGQAFAQFVTETGTGHYGGQQLGSTNWFMVSAERADSSRRFQLRSMLSAEPWTVRGCGYPNLLATGEVCAGDSIHDRQHPHDLFMELAASYEQNVTPTVRWGIYGGPVGAPALGPPAFMHRPSAMSNPGAPIGHHWIDSTHVTFAVVTAALGGARWKVESSLFNGREPDDQRYDFDIARLDSFSARVSINPNDALALQVSAGHLDEAEAGIGRLPRQDVNRVTASAIGVRRLAHGIWSTTVAYGLKWGPTSTATGFISQHSSAVLLESSASTSATTTWFGRAEIVGKPAHDLHADEFSPAVFAVTKLQFGYLRRIATRQGFGAGIGASLDAAVLPPALAPRYAGRVAPGIGVFLRISTVDALVN